MKYCIVCDSCTDLDESIAAGIYQFTAGCGTAGFICTDFSFGKGMIVCRYLHSI